MSIVGCTQELSSRLDALIAFKPANAAYLSKDKDMRKIS